MASLVAQMVKNIRRPRFSCWVRKIPWNRKWQPAPVFLPGELHWQRSLEGYSPRGCKESDTSEWLTLSLHVYIIMKIHVIEWEQKTDSGASTSLALSNQLISCSPWTSTSHLHYLHPYTFLLPHILYWRMRPSFFPYFVPPTTFITPLCSRDYTSEMNKILYLEML